MNRLWKLPIALALFANAGCSSNNPAAQQPVIPAFPPSPATNAGGPDISPATFAAINGRFVPKQDILDLKSDGTFAFQITRPTQYSDSHTKDGSTVIDHSAHAVCNLAFEGKVTAIGAKNPGGAVTQLRFQVSSANPVRPTDELANPRVVTGGDAIVPDRVCADLAAHIQGAGSLTPNIRSADANHLSLSFNLNYTWSRGSEKYSVAATEPRGPAAILVKSGIPPIDVTTELLAKLAGNYRELLDSGARPAHGTAGSLVIEGSAEGSAQTLALTDNACGYSVTGSIRQILVGGGIAKIVLTQITVNPEKSADTQTFAGTRSAALCAQEQDAWTHEVSGSFVGLIGDIRNHQIELELPTKSLPINGDWGADRAQNTDAADFDTLSFEGVTF